MPKASNSESKVFYLKMKGDYFRYLAEVATGDVRTGKTKKKLSFFLDITSACIFEAFNFYRRELKLVKLNVLRLVLYTYFA